jgi:hypothetical protein
MESLGWEREVRREAAHHLFTWYRMDRRVRWRVWAERGR